MEKELSNDMVERIIAEATYYAQGKTTVKEAADRFGVSERTFQLDLNNRLISAINKKIFELNNNDSLAEENKSEEILRYRKLPFEVLRAKGKVITRGNIKGGKIGKRGPNNSINVYNEIADFMINSFNAGISYSLEDLSHIYDISSSTLYESFMKYLDSDKKERIEEIFEFNGTKGKQRK